MISDKLIAFGLWARRTCDNAHEISEGFQTSLTYDFAVIQRNACTRVSNES